MNTVKVVASKSTGKVINESKTKAGEAWLMVESETEVFRGGRLFKNRRLGFLRQTLGVLSGLSLADQFASLQGSGVDCSGIQILAPKGFVAGQVLPGRVVVQDSLEPIMAANPEFGKRIPAKAPKGTAPAQVGLASAFVRDQCTKHGMTYMQSGKTIYRKTFYSPYPEGHALAEADCILSPDNLDQVDAFIAGLDFSGAKPATPGTGLDNAKEQRLAELKAIAKAKRTDKERAELADLVAELE